jgi:hypothetical protein
MTAAAMLVVVTAAMVALYAERAEEFRAARFHDRIFSRSDFRILVSRLGRDIRLGLRGDDDNGDVHGDESSENYRAEPRPSSND